MDDRAVHDGPLVDCRCPKNGARGVAQALAACLAGLLPVSAYAQSYPVHTYTAADGLPSSEVYAAAQDSAGRLWLATRSGVVTYDGASWEDQGSVGPRGALQFTWLRSDSGGTVWAYSPFEPEPLMVFGPHGRKSFQGPETVEAPEARVTGFDVTTTAAGERLVALGTEGAGALLWRDGHWLRVGHGSGRPAPGSEALPGSTVYGLAGWQGDIFVATDDGVARLSAGGAVTRSAVEGLPAGSRAVLALAARGPAASRGDPELWLLGKDWLGIARGGRFEKLADTAAAAAFLHHGTLLLPDPPDAVYFASPLAIFRLDLATDRLQRLGTANGLLNSSAHALLLDRERNLWIAGPRGVSKVASWRFETFRQAHGLLEDEVSAVAEPWPGRMVLGHNHGLTVFEDGEARRYGFASRDDLLSLRVLDLAVDAVGVTWVAASDRGLGRLDPDGELRWIEGFGRVASVVVDGEATLWVAQDAAIFRRRGERFERYPLGSEPRQIRRLFVDAAGGLLLATNGQGLLRLTDGVLEAVPAIREPGLDNVFAFHEDRRGRRWVGTRAGLLVQDGAAMARPAPPLDLTSPVYFVTEDPHGDLWLGTDDGVVRWDGETAVRYSSREGLAGHETNRAAALVDHRGRLWIGTDRGVSVYRRELDRPVPPLQVEITALEVAGRRFPAAEAHRLTAGESTVTFHFRALSFVDEQAVRYRYRLEGFDDGWSEELPAGQRHVRYTNLPAGSYRFRVEAAGGLGGWSRPAVSPEVAVAEVFWRQTWLILLALSAGGLLLAAVVAAMLRWRHTRELEEKVARRTAELRESEQRYRQLFEDAGIANFLIDPQTATVLDANLSACALCGAECARVIGTPVAELAVGWLARALEQLPEDPSPGGHVMEQLHPASGEPCDLEVWAAPITVHGRRRLLLTALDVTERRRLAEERLKVGKLESLGVLAGGIAHDFNNVLAGILGNVSLARRWLELGKPIERLLAGAETATERGKRLTDQLLIFAQGGAPVCEIADLRQPIAESARFGLAGSQSSCRLEVAADLWPAEADQGQLSQVIHNLVINADQAMPGGGEIVVTAENVELAAAPDPETAPGPYLRIEVADRGDGIAPRIRDKIFDPYFSTRDGRSGLGLASAYAIVRKHRGCITLSSTEGVGTIVAVYLPATPDARLETAAAAAPTAAAGGRILVMDDEPLIREFYRRALSDLGYEVEAVSDGAIAVRRYREALATERSFRGVIMDLTVPGGMGGKAALAELRRVDPEVRAIVASGYSNDPVLAGFRAAGFVGALVKPFTITRLGDALEQVWAETEVAAVPGGSWVG